MTKKDKLEKDAKAMRVRLQKRKESQKTATKTRKEARKQTTKAKKDLVSRLETPSLPTLKKKRSEFVGHKNGFSKKCEVCNKSKVAVIEELYLDWRPVKWIADTFQISVTRLLNHVKGAKLDQKRASNTKGAYRIFMESGIAALESDEVDPNMAAKLALASAQHIDKLEGRIIERRKIEEQKTLKIEAFPMPGPIIEVIEEEEVLKICEES